MEKSKLEIQKIVEETIKLLEGESRKTIEVVLAQVRLKLEDNYFFIASTK